MKTYKQFAVITGASSGLGRAFAFQLAKREINLILAGQPGTGLPETTEELKALGIDVHYMETDLSDHQNVARLTHWINSDFEVALLINNSSIGDGNTRSNYRPTDSDSQLHVMSTSLITWALLPNLQRQRKAYILNVSGVSSFRRIGFKSRTSKAFMRHFTKTIGRELADTNIVVSIMDPGPMTVYVQAVKGILQKILGKAQSPLQEIVVENSIRQLFKQR